MCKEGTVSKTTPGRRETERGRKTDDVKRSSRVCDGEIEMEREGEIVLKAENRKCSETEKDKGGRKKGSGNKVSDSVTRGEIFV